MLDDYLRFREDGRLVQFLTALSPQYEAIGGGIRYRSPFPNVDAIVRELLSQETRLKTASQTLSPSVFLVPERENNDLEPCQIRFGRTELRRANLGRASVGPR